MPTHNKYLCQSCRAYHKLCKYAIDSQDCEYCVKVKKKQKNHICGPKVDKDGRTRCAPDIDDRHVRDPFHDPDLSNVETRTDMDPFHDSEFSNIEILTGIVAFYILSVRTWLFFLRLEVAPHLNEQLTEERNFTYTIISWLTRTFEARMQSLTVEERRLIEPLHTIRAICRVALCTRSMSSPLRSTGDPLDMPSPWSEFRQSDPGSQNILACVIKILSELDSDSIRYRLSTSDWSEEESQLFYGRTSRLLNEIYGVYLANLRGSFVGTTGPRIDFFPLWQLAYRNGDRDFAQRYWSRIEREHPLADLDLSGLSLGHWIVEIEDTTTLCQMTAQNPEIGHVTKSNRFGLSPFDLAAITNRHHSYLHLAFVHRDIQAEIKSLRLAIQAGAMDIVKVLAKLPGPYPYTEFIFLAIRLRKEYIVEFLFKILRQMWLLGDMQRVLRYVDSEGLDYLAWRLRRIIQSEPEAGHAFDDCDVHGVLHS